jgi:hypothetical protein
MVVMASLLAVGLLSVIGQTQTVYAQSTNCDTLKKQIEALDKLGNTEAAEEATANLPRICTPFALLKKVFDFAFLFAGSIAVLMIIVGGFQYMTSAGNEEAAKKGKKTVVYAAIGLIVIIMATAIVNIVTNLITKQ